MPKVHQFPRFGPVEGGAPAPHSSSWTAALFAQSDCSRLAALTRVELDTVEAESAEYLDEDGNLSSEEMMTKVAYARRRHYRAMMDLVAAQTIVADIAHGDRVLSPDDVTTGLPGKVVRDLARVLDREES